MNTVLILTHIIMKKFDGVGILNFTFKLVMRASNQTAKRETMHN
jgi:hypothetical protein